MRWVYNHLIFIFKKLLLTCYTYLDINNYSYSNINKNKLYIVLDKDITLYDLEVNNLIEYRCSNCNRLLFKASKLTGVIEVKCGKCGKVISINRKLEEKK